MDQLTPLQEKFIEKKRPETIRRNLEVYETYLEILRREGEKAPFLNRQYFFNEVAKQKNYKLITVEIIIREFTKMDRAGYMQWIKQYACL